MGITNSYKKKLSKSSLGLTGMHDIYWPVPQSSDPNVFYEDLDPDDLRKTITHIDVLSNKKYNFEAARENNGEYRLYGVRKYLLEDNNAIPGDIVKISRKEEIDDLVYYIELLSSSQRIRGKDHDQILKNKLRKERVEKLSYLREQKSYDPSARKFRSGVSRDAEFLVEKAEIYLVKFQVEGKKYLYVGQDSHCAGTTAYFGSSLVMWHYETTFGKEIFNKIILETVTNIIQRDLNKLERKYINKYLLLGEEKNWVSLNYTGKVKRV